MGVQLFEWAQQKNLALVAFHIPSSISVAADSQSSGGKKMRVGAMSVSEALQKWLEPLEVDLFA